MGKTKISSTKLHNRRINAGSTIYKGASLFPFFDQKGLIQKVLFTSRQEGIVYLVDAIHINVNVSLFGRIKMHCKPLETIAYSDISYQSLSGLWYFDPCEELFNIKYRWLLTRELINQTNCVYQLKKRKRIEYMEFDIGQMMVTRLVGHDRFSGLTSRSIPFGEFSEWLDSGLIDDDSSSPKVNRQLQWQLDPIWDYW